LIRDVFADDFTLGSLSYDGKHLGYTCEDTDRKLEDGNEKVYGKTCIPRGIYPVTVSYSHRFKRPMPEVLDVDGFSGIRIHGGNTSDDTLGCPLLGLQRTQTGVMKCKEVNEKLIQLIEDAEEMGQEVTLEVK